MKNQNKILWEKAPGKVVKHTWKLMLSLLPDAKVRAGSSFNF